MTDALGVEDIMDERPLAVPDDKGLSLENGRYKDIKDQIILEKVEPFNEVFYKNCFYNSLFPVIYHLGKDIDPLLENDILVYGNRDKSYSGPDVFYCSRYTLSQMLDIMNISVYTKTHRLSCNRDEAHINLNSGLIENINIDIGLGIDKTEEIGCLIKDIMEAISRSRPVILWVDCFYESIRTDTYNKIHWPHTLLIYGCNKEKKVFNVIEHNHRDNLSYQPHVISYDDIVNSCKGFIEGFQINDAMPTYLELFLPNDNEEDKVKKPIMLRDNISRYKGELLNGLNYLKEFTSHLSKIIIDEACLIKIGESIVLRLNNIIKVKQVEKFKNAQLFPDSIDNVLLSQNIIDFWMELRNAIARFLYSATYNSQKFKILSTKLEQLYILEYRYVDKLLEL